MWDDSISLSPSEFVLINITYDTYYVAAFTFITLPSVFSSSRSGIGCWMLLTDITFISR